MASIKKVTAIINDSESETVKNNILAATGVNGAAAKVVRDAEGKVVAVELTLPSTAAAAATAAITGNPGIVTVTESEDIIPGTKGVDATDQAQFDAYVAEASATEANTNVTKTFIGDGTLKIEPTAASNFYSWGVVAGAGNLPPYPNEIEAEMKISLNTVKPGSPPVSFYRGGLVLNNIKFDGRLVILEEAGDAKAIVLTRNGSNAAADRVVLVASADEAMHTYKIHMSSTGLLTGYVDDVANPNTLQCATLSKPNRFIFGISGVQSDYTVDYFRYTENV